MCILQLWALNIDKTAGGEAQVVFKEWHDRLNFASPVVISNANDPELLIHVPFDGTVKLKAICVIGLPPRLLATVSRILCQTIRVQPLMLGFAVAMFCFRDSGSGLLQHSCICLMTADICRDASGRLAANANG